MKKILSTVINFLNSEYKNTQSKTIVITTVTDTETLSETKTEKITTESSSNILANIMAISTLSLLILPLLSFFYLTFYLDTFGIAYDELSFNINDLTAILYQKGGFYLYISIAVLFPLVVFLFAVLYHYIGKTFKNWVMVAIILFIAFLFHVILRETSKFSCKLIFSFDIFIIIIGKIYFFSNKTVSYLMLIGVSIFLFRQMGMHDAKQRMQLKPRWNIVIKNETSEKEILSEKEPKKYFIRKTADFIFIMNEKDNTVETYPASDIKHMSFTSKK